MAKRLLPALLLVPLLALALAGTALADAPELAQADASDLLYQAGAFLDPAPALRGPAAEDPWAAPKAAILDGLRERRAEIDLSAYGIPYEDDLSTFKGIWSSVINAHPDLFYVQGAFRYYYSGASITSVLPTYNDQITDEMVAAFHARGAAILAMLEPGWTGFQKALFLHDYLVTHCDYDLTYSRRSAYDALVGRSAVCQGYALAYVYLCSEAGLDVGYVTSAALNHAWNTLTLDGELFYVDCTWDDPTGVNNDAFCGHSYFLRSRDCFDHSTVKKTGAPATDWLCDGTPIFDSTPGATDYDDAWFIDVESAIPMLGATAAYAKTADRDNVYLRDLGTDTETAVALPARFTWYVVGSQYSFFGQNYAGFAALDGCFYFTGPTQIFRMRTDGAPEAVYALSDEERSAGYLYGIAEDGGTLNYLIGAEPPGNGQPFTRFPLVLTTLTSGVCGDGVSWALEDEHTLVISGTGAMAAYPTVPPWYGIRSEIMDVRVGAGVTAIGDGAFRACEQARSIVLPASVTSVGAEAFNGCAALTDVVFTGTQAQWDAVSFAQDGDAQAAAEKLRLVGGAQAGVFRTSDAGAAVSALVYCAEGLDGAMACGARYGADGRFLGAETWTLRAGVNRLEMTGDGAERVRFFAMAACVPLCAAA